MPFKAHLAGASDVPSELLEYVAKCLNSSVGGSNFTVGSNAVKGSGPGGTQITVMHQVPAQGRHHMMYKSLIRVTFWVAHNGEEGVG